MSTDNAKSLGQQNYEQFADRYAAAAPTKPHNALYERPATLSLLPGDLRGLRVLDAGCGPGLYSEILAARGASVHAFDVTPEMVALAQARTAGLDVEVRTGNLEQPLDWLADAQFDIVLCPLVLDYIEDWAPVFAEFRRVARRDALLVFSASHPIDAWRLCGDGNYHQTEAYAIPWKGFGEPLPVVNSYRRPLSGFLNPLMDAGWALETLLEPQPLEAMREVNPQLHAWLSRAPCFLCVRARRR
ncbi:class I SAM-dependent methyltransferase [Cupriavidus sp. D39]|uniref:class I SAM-dependent methyltransferase n=1 Tax=Cupriavidus sp. D39 TaxID=2997877 RepID=UPI00226FCE69|nr:class I SAM-dependent methyltransferase [Cupriavidus sp. D39]MCY0858305.1 class I SAM-dependent methyltransferase [Cupriavidus sp. D39]